METPKNKPNDRLGKSSVPRETYSPERVRERGDTAQVGAPEYTRVDEYKAEAMEGLTMSIVELIGVYKNVVNRLSRKYPIWKPDLECLCQVGLYLQEHDRRTVNWDDLFKYSGFSAPKRPRARKRLERMSDQGYLQRVRSHRGKGVHPGACGYALTELGFKVLREFGEEFERVEGWHLENKERKRLAECVMYLDKAEEFLGRFQSAILNEDQREYLRQISVD